jgi:UDP-N-acetyl-2-amino-2-deoxyglucuronate dehydrogenase
VTAQLSRRRATPFGVGMIGLGAVSYVHEAGYFDLCDACAVTAMCDVDEELVRQRAGVHDATAYTRYEDLLDDPAVDAVDIAVPHALHHEVALAALRRGKHVLLEKPVAVSERQGRELVDAAAEAGLLFTVAENTRYVAAYEAAASILEGGALGLVHTVRAAIAGSEVCRIRDPLCWHGTAPHGGVLLDSTVHSVYLLAWLFGEVRDVRAFSSTLVPGAAAEDNVLVFGDLAGGARFQLSTTCTAELPWTERLEVYGDAGSLIVDQLADPVVKVWAGPDDMDGWSPAGVEFDPQGWKLQSIVAEVRDFVEALVEGRAPRVDPEDAVYAVRVAEAAARSIELNAPVEVAARAHVPNRRRGALRA